VNAANGYNIKSRGDLRVLDPPPAGFLATFESMSPFLDSMREAELKKFAREWYDFATTQNTGGLQEALDEGQDINDIALSVENEEFTALSAAAGSGSDRSIEFLIASGADLNLSDNAGFTPLMRVAEKAPISTARTLLNAHASVNAQSKTGRTALHEAAFRGRSDLCALLLQRQADVSVKDNNGQTALHAAARSAQAGPVLLLLKAGADANATDLEGKTPAEIKGASRAARQALKDGPHEEESFGGFGGHSGNSLQGRAAGLGHVTGFRGPKDDGRRSTPAPRATAMIDDGDIEDKGEGLFSIPDEPRAEPRQTQAPQKESKPQTAPSAGPSGLVESALAQAKASCASLLVALPQDDESKNEQAQEIARALAFESADDLYDKQDELEEQAREAGACFSGQWKLVVAKVDDRLAIGFSLDHANAENSDRSWQATLLSRLIPGAEFATGDEFPAFHHDDWDGQSPSELAFLMWSQGFSLAIDDARSKAFERDWLAAAKSESLELASVDFSGLSAFDRPAQALAQPARKLPKMG